MQCRSPNNFMSWQEWSAQFERRSAFPGKFRRLINNATQPFYELPIFSSVREDYLDDNAFK